jgi:hypothetical protein
MERGPTPLRATVVGGALLLSVFLMLAWGALRDTAFGEDGSARAPSRPPSSDSLSHREDGGPPPARSESGAPSPAATAVAEYEAPIPAVSRAEPAVLTAAPAEVASPAPAAGPDVQSTEPAPLAESAPSVTSPMADLVAAIGETAGLPSFTATSPPTSPADLAATTPVAVPAVAPVLTV